MITFTNHKVLPEMEFGQYLSSPGYSNSFFKYNINGVMPTIDETPKMRLGSMVDAIITGGKSFPPNSASFQQAKRIAMYMLDKMPYLYQLKKQVGVTATAEYSGFTIHVKSLVDFVLPRIATVEMKVCGIKSKDAEKHIEYMGYDNQCYIERSCANVPKSYLLIYCAKSDDIFFSDRKTPTAPDWMAEQILKFGTA